MSYTNTEEFHPGAVYLDTLETEEMVRLFVEADIRALEAVLKERAVIAQASELVAKAIGEGGRYIGVGAGSSAAIDHQDKRELGPTFNISSEQAFTIIAGGTRALLRAVEGAEDDTNDACRKMCELNLTHKDVVCGVAASGTTPFTLAALACARKHGARTIFFSCGAVPTGENGEPVADIVIHLDIGPPVIHGSTRLSPGTAQKSVLNAISSIANVLNGKTYGGLMVNVQAKNNNKLRKRAVRYVHLLSSLIKERAQTLLVKDRTQTLLVLSDWEVKVAVVMRRKGVSVKEAERILRVHSGNLRAIIGDVDYTRNRSS